MFEWGVRAMGCNLGYGCQNGAVSATVLGFSSATSEVGEMYGELFELFKSDSHSLKNRKAESQNVYQHVADGHSHPILNFSWLVIRSCTNLKFVKHNERGRRKADGRYDRSSIVRYVALGFRTSRLTEITLKPS